MESTIAVGRLIKSFGKDGFMRMIIDPMHEDSVTNSYYLLIEQEGFQLPFFIEDIDLENGLVKFDEIHGPEDTKIISDKELFLLKRHTKPIPDNDDHYSDAIGFSVYDQNDVLIGHIKEILSLPMQEILVVTGNKGEIMVPFHEDLLIEFQSVKRSMKLEIAEGLLDL